MILDTLNLKPSEMRIETVLKQNLNEAVDGSMYGYYFGERKEIQVKLDFISAEQKKEIEDLATKKFKVVLDTGEKYNMRIANNISWEKYKLLDSSYIYSTTLYLIEVVV